MTETKKRSIAKSLTFRVLATILTVAIVFYATGSFALSAGVGLIDVVAKLALFYGHERIWDRVNWGVT